MLGSGGTVSAGPPMVGQSGRHGVGGPADWWGGSGGAAPTDPPTVDGPGGAVSLGPANNPRGLRFLASAEVRLSREAYAGAAATALRDANSATAWAAPVAPPCNDPEVPLATEKPKSTADIGVAEADAELVDADTAYAALCARFGGDLSVEHLASLPREQVQALSAVLHDRHTTRHD